MLNKTRGGIIEMTKQELIIKRGDLLRDLAKVERDL